MRIIRTVAAVAATVSLAGVTTAARQQSADEREIRRVVTEYYFEGGRTGDSSLTRQAFDLGRAHMFYVQGDTLVDVPIPEYVRRVGSARSRPNYQPDTNQRRVLMVDVAGTAAVAKLEIRTQSAVLTDYMSLLKVGGRWVVVNKIFSRG